MEPDRVPDGYEPEFDIDLKRGQQGEMFVRDIIDALSEGGHRIEVKRDDRSQGTGNIYVEYECKRRGRFVPSGLSSTQAQLWVFVLEVHHMAVCISVERLKELGRDAYRQGRIAEEKDGSHPTKGVLIPLTTLAGAATRAVRTKLKQ